MAKHYTIRNDAGVASVFNPDNGFDHFEVHVVYYVDNTYAATVTPSAGTAPVVCSREPDGFTSTVATLDSTTPDTFVQVSGHMQTVTVTPAGTTGSGAYIAHLTAIDFS